MLSIFMSFNIYLSMDWCPAVNEILSNTQSISCLIDELANVDRGRNNFLPVFGVVKSDVVPRCFGRS
jgi:hypothetical protein